MSTNPEAQQFPSPETVDFELELSTGDYFRYQMREVQNTLRSILVALEQHELTPVEHLKLVKQYGERLHARYNYECGYYRQCWGNYYERLEGVAIERKEEGQRQLAIRKHDRDLYLAREKHYNLGWLRQARNRRHISRLEKERKQLVDESREASPPLTIEAMAPSLREMVFGSQPQE